jgi:hypothetical protein
MQIRPAPVPLGQLPYTVYISSFLQNRGYQALDLEPLESTPNMFAEEAYFYSPNFYIYIYIYIYRVVQRSVNLEHSLVLKGIFRFKPTNQSVKRYHNVVRCALSMEDFISNVF